MNSLRRTEDETFAITTFYDFLTRHFKKRKKSRFLKSENSRTLGLVTDLVLGKPGC